MSKKPIRLSGIILSLWFAAASAFSAYASAAQPYCYDRLYIEDTVCDKDGAQEEYGQPSEFRTVTVRFVDEDGNSVKDDVVLEEDADGEPFTDGSIYDVSELAKAFVSGFVFEYSDSVTVGTVCGDTVITAVYAADADEDGIADKYQAAVTFRTVGGTFANGTTELTLVLTLRNELGEPATAADGGRAILFDEDIPLVKACEDFENGVWDPVLCDGTVVTGDTEFVHTFTAVQYRTVTVEFVDGDGNAVSEAVSFSIGSDGKKLTDGSEYDVSHAVPLSINDGDMVLDLVEGDTAGEVNGDTLIRAVYAPDKNRDGIADKYQIKVVFTAFNGSFNGKRSESIVLTLRDDAGHVATAENGGAAVLDAYDIPSAQPDKGYENGSWAEPKPSVGMSISADTAFSYKYSAAEAVPLIGDSDVSVNSDSAEVVKISAAAPVVYVPDTVYGTVQPNHVQDTVVKDKETAADTERPADTEKPDGEDDKPVRIDENTTPLAPAKDNKKDDADEAGYMSWIFASIVTVIVLGILFFIIITVRKKKYDDEEENV